MGEKEEEEKLVHLIAVLFIHILLVVGQPFSGYTGQVPPFEVPQCG